MLAGLAAMASFRANATFTESKLNDIAVKNDGGSIIVYHAGTGGNPSAAFDGNTDTYYEKMVSSDNYTCVYDQFLIDWNNDSQRANMEFRYSKDLFDYPYYLTVTTTY